MPTDDSSWARALMATSGVAMGHGPSATGHTADWYAAASDETPLAHLQKLAASKDPEVRTLVARRPDCPMGLLATLAHDRRPDIRATVAGNPRLTPAIAEHLLHDREREVLKALARNEAIDMDILERLALHRKDDVRRVAGRVLDQRAGTTAALPSGTQRQGAAMPPELRDRAAMPAEVRDRAAVPPEVRDRAAVPPEVRHRAAAPPAVGGRPATVFAPVNPPGHAAPPGPSRPLRSTFMPGPEAGIP